MTAILEQVVEALRDELQQYGELLARLEVQNGYINRGEAPSILHATESVDNQHSLIEAVRAKRETLQRQLAWTLGHPARQSIRELLPLLPDHYQLLFVALIQEINQLIERAAERIHLHQIQLRRSLHLNERLLAAISSQANSALLAMERNPSGAEPTSCTVSAAIV